MEAFRKQPSSPNNLQTTVSEDPTPLLAAEIGCRPAPKRGRLLFASRRSPVRSRLAPLRKVLEIARFLAYGDQGDDGSGGGPGCMRGALDLDSVAPLLRLAPERRLRVRLRVLLLGKRGADRTSTSVSL
jgi:hypothetical protein